MIDYRMAMGQCALILAGAIVVGAALVAGAVVWS